MDPGIQRFCSRYTRPKHLKDDPIAIRLSETWDDIGYGVELSRPDHGWLYAPEPRTRSPLLHANLEMLTRKNYSSASPNGTIYKLTLHAPIGELVNIEQFLIGTRKLHKDIIHVIVGNLNAVSVTIPALHGVDGTAELIGAFLGAGLENARGFPIPVTPALCSDWPEYVLWPNHMLSFYDYDFKGPLLEV